MLLRVHRSCAWAVLFLAAALNLVLAAGSREVRVGPTPEWVQPVSRPATDKPASQSVGRDYLLVESQHNIANESYYSHTAYRLLDEAGLRNGSQISLTFDPTYQQLTIHKLAVIRGSQELDRLDPANIQVIQRESDLEDLLYHGELSALVILKDVRIGDVIELAYTRTGANPVFGGRHVSSTPLNWGMPIAHLRQRIIVPPDRTLAHRVLGTTPIKVSETQTPLGREWLWEAKNVPATVYDDTVPSWHQSNAFVQVTEFPTWRTVVEWALPLYDEAGGITEAVQAQARALDQPGGSVAERALRALKFVQDDIRYLGIEEGDGSHRPSPPADVLMRRFGDCKDKARLLVSLLRAMDIEAAPVLVSSGWRHTVRELLPSPYAFNHVIVQVSIAGQTYIVDPTLSFQAGGIALRHTARYGAGLPITPDAKDLAVWPASPNDAKTLRVSETFQARAFDRPATLRVVSTYSGRAAENMRSYLATNPREDVQKSYVNFYARYYPEITASSGLSWKDNPQTNSIVVTEEYTVPRLFSKAENSTVWKAEFAPTALNDYTGSPGAGGRTAPLAVDHPVDITSHTRAELPEPWTIEVDEKKLEGDAFSFVRSTKGRDNVAEWTYHWRSKADHVPVARFGDYSRQLAQVRDVLGAELTYNTAGAAAGFQINWAQLAFAGVVLLAATAGAVWLWRRKPPKAQVEIGAPPPLKGEYEGIGGWLILVAIGVILRPIANLISLWSSLTPCINDTTWTALTSKTSSLYREHYAVVATTEMAVTLVLLVAYILTVFLFFGRRRSFPLVITAVMATEAAYAFFEVWAHTALQGTSEDVAKTAGQAGQAVVVALVWIPYFALSKRVRQTFTR